MMMSASADIRESHFKRMHDIKLFSIPIDPVQLVLSNRWQLATYCTYSLFMKTSNQSIMRNISPRAFSFHSKSWDTYFIVYNSDLPPDEVRFHIAHEIGHIFYGHISKDMPVMTKEDIYKPQRDLLADDFARFVLQMG